MGAFSFDIKTQLFLAGDPDEDLQKYSITPRSLNNGGSGAFKRQRATEFVARMSPYNSARNGCMIAFNHELLTLQVRGEGAIVLSIKDYPTILLTARTLLLHDASKGCVDACDVKPGDSIEYTTLELAGARSLAFAMTTGNAFYARSTTGEDADGEIQRGDILVSARSSDFLRPQTPEKVMMRQMLAGVMPDALSCPVGFGDDPSPMLFGWIGNINS
jgi:hypothetical protein